MAFPPRIALASKNLHKLREIQAICAHWPVEWVTVETHEGVWPDVEEPHDTYLRNALDKARAVAAALGVPAVADDSGLEVDALGGAPGVRSARFRCVTAVAWPDGRELHTEGVCEGTLGTKERGEGGFGYDPLFVPEGWGRTMAELEPAEKDRLSHRGRAFRALGTLLAAEDEPGDGPAADGSGA